MSKPIKCPSCNVNMDILSNLVSGEDDLYSAKVECPSCLSRFTPVLASTETRARRMTAKLTREWIAKLKTCDKAGECALQTHEVYKTFPRPPRAPGSRWKTPLEFPHYPPADQGWRFPPVVTMYMASGPSVTYSSDATVTTTDVVKLSVDELMNLRSQGLLSDTKKEDPNEVP